MATKTSNHQIGTSVAPTVFSAELNSQLQEKLARHVADQSLQGYVIRCLVFIASAAVHPEFLAVKRRLASFAAIDTDEASKSIWSDAGFFLVDGRTCACFHCGNRCRFAAGQTLEDAIQLHRRTSPDCELARLLALVVLGPRAAPATAEKLRRAIAKLLADLRSSGLLEHVESYGFDRRLVAFCACRLFMRTKDGRMSQRPGDLIQAMHNSEDLLNGLPDSLNIYEALIEIESLSAAAATVAQPTTVEPDANNAPTKPQVCHEEAAKAAETVQATLQEKAATSATAKTCTEGDSSESEQCTTCRLRTRDQVTLPCAHFLLCRQCASERRKCPKCDRDILATVRAFIA